MSDFAISFPPLPFPFLLFLFLNSKLGLIDIRTWRSRGVSLFAHFSLLETLSQKILVYGNQHIQMRGGGRTGDQEITEKGGREIIVCLNPPSPHFPNFSIPSCFFFPGSFIWKLQKATKGNCRAPVFTFYPPPQFRGFILKKLGAL